MDDFAKALGVEPRFVKAALALLLIAIVYQWKPEVGWALGVLAIVAIVTR